MESTELMTVNNSLIRNVDDLSRIGKMMAISGYFEDARDAAKAAVKVSAGMEMGFGPFASMTGIHIIKGKPAVGANLMAAAVKGNPRYDYRVRKMEDSEVSIEFFERIDGKRESIGVSTFTAADAQKAGTQNMGRFPRNMLFARAISNGIRWYCPDVFSGNATYVPEELGAEVDDEGNVISMPQMEAPAPIAAEPEVIEAEVIEPAPEPEPKPEAKPRKKFDEVEFLTNFHQPQAVMKMAYNNAKGFASDKTGQLYDDMTTKDLYCHWIGLAKKLQTPDLAQDVREGLQMKISAICAIIWKRKQDLTLKDPVTGK